MTRRTALVSGLAWLCVLTVALTMVGAAAAQSDGTAGQLPAATCTVTSAADSGPGSLRACLQAAASGTVITFDPAVFPPASPATIAITSGQLPDLDDGNVTIDASSAGVILDGSAFTGGEDGLGITSNSNTVKGLQILRFPGDALEITGSGNTIGGATAGSRNVLSGNGQNGIRIRGASAVSNTVRGNTIGADASGLHGLANGRDGVQIAEGASGNLIGGPGAADRNLIFANRDSGVSMYHDGTQNNTVQGNWIGLPAAGAVRQAFPTDQAISPAYATDCTLFVSTLTSGVYKSTDCGATWAEANTGLTQLRLMQVEFPPDSTGPWFVFALVEDGDLFVSHDGGANWSLVSTVLEGIDRRNLVLSADFKHDQTMYAAAQNWAWDELGGQPGVFKSTDEGVTWTRTSNGMNNTNVWKVIASPDPVAKNTLFALTNGGIQKSTDGGANWAAIPAPDGSFNDLAISPAFATDQTVIVTAWNGEVYRSTNGGATWASIASGRGDPRHPAFSPAYATDRALCYGQNWNDRVTCSTDGGATWAEGNTGLPGGGMNPSATMLAIAPNFAANHTLFAIRNSGIAKSANGGAAWQTLTGLRELGNFSGVAIGYGASLNTVRGNVVSNNETGVRITHQETHDNVVSGNLIGTDPTGAFAQANTQDGIQVAGRHNTIGGAGGRNVVSGSLVDGVRVAGDGTTGNVVAGNYIGTNAAGTAAIGNQGAGVSIHSQAHDNLIGGDTAAARNLISGNGYGLGMWDTGTMSNTVSGNYIGTDGAGLAALGNGNGVQIWGGASYNVIGGATAGARNIISGNQRWGIEIFGTDVSHNRVQGNYIGVDATGIADLGNNGFGVCIQWGASANSVENNVISGNVDGVAIFHSNTMSNTVIGNLIGTDATGNRALSNRGKGVMINFGAQGNTIGGDSAAERNVISGNSGDGVSLVGAARNNTIIGNYIGTNINGTAAIGNVERGIGIWSGASNNLIGGTGAGEGNLIRNNAGPGILVQDGASIANTITRNSIGHNAQAGIALRDGGNANLAAPRITAKDLVAGTASGTTCANCTVEVFSADDDEGQIYEGTAVANGSGAWALNAGHAFAGPYVTATATDPAGNTSPFSSPFNLLVFNLNVSNTRQALDNLGLSYTLVDAAGFGAVNLADYDVLFVGFTGNDPQGDSLLQPLLDRKADIAAFVQAGGGLVANSEDGVVATALDWQWTPVTVTHRNAGGSQMQIALPGHELVEGLTETGLQGWWPFHNTFTQWTWPGAEAVITDPGSGEAIVLAGAYGAGRMVLSGSDPDYHSGNTGADRLLSNELYWAAKMLRPRPPQISSFAPGQDNATATTALIQVVFDKLMDAATINAGTLTVVGSASGAHAGILTYLAGSATAIFAPAAPFTVGERVTVTVRAAITDLAGRGLDGDRDGVAEGAPADDFTWSFTVRAGGTCTVGSTGDSGPDTLRQCLQDAQPGDTVAFAPAVFPITRPATITLTSGALPELNRGYVTVDAGNLGVILDGSRLTNGAGFRITSAGNAIYGLKIVGFPEDGVQIDGAGAWNNTVGMTAGGRRNVIGGNRWNGVRINNGASRNTVGSNFIGLDVPSWAALPNGENGVAIHDGASYNLIGAAAAAGASADALALPPGNVIFANVNDGVSIWGGGTMSNTVTGNWLGLRPGVIPQASPTDMAISPAYTADGIVYVATTSGGIYKTADRGATWAQANAGLSGQGFAAVRISPDATDANTAYALDKGGALYVTHDGAAAWSLVSRTMEQFDRRGLAFSPRFATDHTMYAAARDWAWQEIGGQPGVFKSTDGGVTWSRSSSGLGDTRINKVVAPTDPAATGVLYALSDNSLQKSTDGGANWTNVALPTGNLRDVALSPAFGSQNTLAVVAGGQFLFSTDRGATWTSHPDPRGDPRGLAFSPDYATDHRICHGGGWNDTLYCTTDGGANWTQTRTLLPAPPQEWATSVAFAPGFGANRTIFVLSIAGLTRSTDGGASWQLLRGLRDLGNTSGVSLRQGASFNTIGPGNVIANNNFGVQFNDEATAYNVVIGNLVGLTPAGTAALPNSDQQIGHWGGQHNRIGGPATSDRNIIASGGGGYSGIYLARRETHDILVQGNWIGTDVTGLNGLGVNNEGISIAEDATNITVLKNVIAASGGGVLIRGGDTSGNRVVGNLIGLAVNGRAPLGNRGDGVTIREGAHDNMVGGAAPDDRNVIAGNGSNGISIYDPDTRNNNVAGNWIGLNMDGAPAGNRGNGVQIGNGSHDNRIGGPGISDRNVIAGNGDGCDWCDGVQISNHAHHNTVQGNFIGTDPTGAVAIPNRFEGVDLWSGNDNAILDNLVSGNGQNQIALWNGAQRNRIEGNRVGTDASGSRPIGGMTTATTTAQASATAASAPPRYEPCQGPESYGELKELLGEAAPADREGQWCGSRPAAAAAGQAAAVAAENNDRPGIYISQGASRNTIGVSNTIAFNHGDGVRVEQDNALENTISRNSIHHNDGLGIRLRDGANRNLAAPRVLGVSLATGVITGTACAGCTVEVFSTADEEGQTFAGATVAGGDGKWRFDAGGPLAGPNITATATDAQGDTSPFSSLVNILWVNLGVGDGRDALERLGLPYTEVSGAAFATADLSQYNVLFVGSARWAPNPNYLQPLVDRKAAIAAFVAGGGGLVALGETGEWGNGRTALDWTWLPITVTAQPDMGRKRLIAPAHLVAQGLTSNHFLQWYGNSGYYFTAWGWPGATSVAQGGLDTDSQLLVGPYGAGRLAVAGSFADAGVGDGLLRNLLLWAGGRLADAPPQLVGSYPPAGGWAAPNTGLRLTFSEIISPTTVTAASLTVVGSRSGALAGQILTFPDLNVVRFLPNQAFQVGETVTVTVRGALQDMTGNGLDGNRDGRSDGSPADDVQFSFTVRAGGTITVTTTNVAGAGSLSEALTRALPGDRIVFDPAVFPPHAPATIRPAQAAQQAAADNGWLPNLETGYVTIDASDAGVILDADGRPLGLKVRSDGNTLRGLTLIHGDSANLSLAEGASFNTIGGDRAAGAGPNGQGNTFGRARWVNATIESVGTISNTVQGNHFGTDPKGLERWSSKENYQAGLIVGEGAAYTTVDSNLFSGNSGDGLAINGSDDGRFTNNRFGTDRAGTAALPNTDCGAGIRDGARRNVLQGNLFSGNGWCGLQAFERGTRANTVIGNSFGPNTAGTEVLSGQSVGLYVANYVEQMLVEGNVFAGGDAGIFVRSHGGVYRNNAIGTNLAGTASWPVRWAGMYLYGRGGVAGGDESYNNLIEGNLVAHNAQGVVIRSLAGGRVDGNTLRRNRIYDSTGSDLVGDGSRIEDGIALLGGANGGIRPPIVQTFNLATGAASGTACANCTVEVFSDADDEGRWFEGTTTANGAGAWTFAAGHAFTGPNVHATATDAAGNTSEFSAPAPTIANVSPVSSTPGTRQLVVTINGDFFRDNPPSTGGVTPPVPSFGAGISVTNVAYLNRHQVKAYLDIAPSAAVGPREVRVTGYDGQAGVRPGGFQVVPLPPPPPAVNAVLAEVVSPGVTGDLQVTGAGFIDLPRVQFSGAGVTVNRVTFKNPGSLWINVTVAPTATLGARAVTVINPDGQSATRPGALTVITPYFTDVAAAAGLGNSSGEHGAAWGDWNRDGWLDLAVGRGALFTNQTGVFTDSTTAAGLDAISDHGGVSWGDYDNDGKLDLLSSWGKVYRNPGSLPFAKVQDDTNWTGASWADFDRDGKLDYYAGGRLFRNTGSGFTDVTAMAGLGGLKPNASVWADFNNDGFPDVYFTCNGCPSRLFRNNGNGTFADISSPARVGGISSAHGAAWGDYDNDGDLDLFVANNNNEYNLLYRNEGGAYFTEVAALMGLRNAPGNSTGCNWLDYNLDGRLDLFVVGRDSPNRLFRNDRTTFTEVTLASGVGDSRDSDGSTVGDYDNDGDPDIYVVSGIWGFGVSAQPNGGGTPDFLFRNNVAQPGRPAPAWLKVRLQGTLSNAQGIGARVRLVAGGLEQVRQIAGSTGYLSQDAPEALFGLGATTGPAAVEVRWPSGRVETRTGIMPNQVIVITESTGRLHDIAMVDVAPTGETPINTPLTPLATVRNLGAVPDMVQPVVCTITRGGAPVYQQTLSFGIVPPALWASRTFPPFTPTQAGVYNLNCRVSMPGDQNGANDALTRPITVTQQIADAWTKDNPNDTGAVPSGYDNWYMSPDLWVRNAADGGLIHQDPIKGQTNTVYVRLRNRGNTAVITGTVSVYWIEPSLGVRCGGWAPIGVIPFTNLLPGEVRIVSVPWVPTRSGHTCLQDVIDSSQDPYNRGLECAPQWVPWDNNVEWHNVNILTSSSLVTAQGLLDVKDTEVQLVNVYDQPQDVDLIIQRMTFPMTGTITVRLPAELFERWLGYGAHWGEGIEVITDTQEIRVTAPVSATIGAVPMLADEAAAVGLHFEGPAGLTFEMAIQERIQGITTGGVAYQWVIPDTTPPQLVGRTPAPNAAEVGLAAPVVLTFDEPIGPLSLKLALAPDPGGWSATWNDASTVVTATHTALAVNQDYTITVNANDAAGNPLAPVTWSFTTRPKAFPIYLPLVRKQ